MQRVGAAEVAVYRAFYEPDELRYDFRLEASLPEPVAKGAAELWVETHVLRGTKLKW